MSFSGLVAIAKAGFFSVYCDKSMLVVDFFLATSVPFLVQLLIWSHAFPEKESLVEGYTLMSMYIYYGAALALNRLNNAYDLILRVSEHVTLGLVECFQLKPINYVLYNAALFFGESLLYFVPPVLIAIATIAFTGEVIGPIGFLGMLVLAQVCCFLLGYALAGFIYWTIKPDALLSFHVILFGVASGTLLPLSFWPGWLQPFMKYSPFRLVVGGPAEFLVNPSADLGIELLLLYVFWCPALVGWIIVFSYFNRNKYHGAGG